MEKRDDGLQYFFCGLMIFSDVRAENKHIYTKESFSILHETFLHRRSFLNNRDYNHA